MAERAWYQVARLTRPARLRCRPCISVAHRQFGSTANPGDLKRDSKPQLSFSPLKGVERRDYEDALELAQKNGTEDARSPQHGKSSELVI